MRNGQNILWWILGIYFIFFVTDAVLGEAAPSKSDTASDDSDLSQSQTTKIMDKIYEVEIRLLSHIDQKYLEIKEENNRFSEVGTQLHSYMDYKINTLRDDVKKEIETLRKEITTFREKIDGLEKVTGSFFKEQREQMHGLEKVTGSLFKEQREQMHGLEEVTDSLFKEQREQMHGFEEGTDSLFKEQREQMHGFDKITSALETRVNILEIVVMGLFASLIGAIIVGIFRWIQRAQAKDPAVEQQPAADSSTPEDPT